MKEEYLEIEELDVNAECDEQQAADPKTGQKEFLPTQPADFDVHCDDAMLRKLLRKFQMSFLYPLLKAFDITYRSLRYLSVDDINTAIRSVGQRAEFREKLFSWRRKRYRTNDPIIEHEKVVSLNSTANDQQPEVVINTASCSSVNVARKSKSNHVSVVMPQTGIIIPEMAMCSTSSAMYSKDAFGSPLKPIKWKSVLLESPLQEIIQELPVDIDFEPEQKKPKLIETTVQLRETRLSVQLNLTELLEDSLYGPVMRAFYEKNGFLERKHRDELIQCIIDYVINNDIKLHASDFNKIVDMVISIFPNEEEARDYYFINRKGKRNPMGRLYTKYYNTLKRMRVRDIHQEFTQESAIGSIVSMPDEASSPSTTQMSSTMMGSSNQFQTTSAAALGDSNSGNNSANIANIDAISSNSSSIDTKVELNEDDFQEVIQLDDTSIGAIKNFLRCQGLEWDDVKRMWAKTYLARQEDIEHSAIKDVLQQWPKYLNARGMELFDIDFCLKYSRHKATALHQKWQKFAQKIFSFYQANIKDDMCKGLFALCKSKPGKDTEDYIITVLLNAIMLPMTRYRDALGNRRKISIVEAVDLFAIRVNALEDLDQKREEFSIKYGDIHTDYTPLIVVVGDANINIHEIYVHFDVALYEMPDFVSALDCCMKIYRVFNLPYPPSNEYSWTFMQRYFYEITLADDIKCPSMSSLITYLKL